jgi:hypothetical protein
MVPWDAMDVPFDIEERIMNIHMLAHFIFMPLAFALMAASVVVLRKGKETRLTLHRNLALAGMLCGLIAFGFVFALKAKLAYSHFHSPHAIVGAIAMVVLLLAVISGGLASKKKNPALPHKIGGKIAMLFMIGSLVMGITRLVLMLK